MEHKHKNRPRASYNNIKSYDDELAIVLINGEAKTNIWAKNQKELDEEIKQIDKAPASVTFE